MLSARFTYLPWSSCGQKFPQWHLAEGEDQDSESDLSQEDKYQKRESGKEEHLAREQQRDANALHCNAIKTEFPKTLMNIAVYGVGLGQRKDIEQTTD